MFRLKVRKSRRIRGEADDFGPTVRRGIFPESDILANLRADCER